MPSWERATTLMHGFRLDDEGTWRRSGGWSAECGYAGGPAHRDRRGGGPGAALRQPCADHRRGHGAPGEVPRCDGTGDRAPPGAAKASRPTYMNVSNVSPPRPATAWTPSKRKLRAFAHTGMLHEHRSHPSAVRFDDRHGGRWSGSRRFRSARMWGRGRATRRRRRTGRAISWSIWRSRGRTRSAAAIAEAVEDVGGQINAYTAREQTAYYVKLLKEDLALGADIIGDILTHSVFDPEELERERGVILQEIGQANDTPDDIIFDHFQEICYPDQPMGRPTLGREAGIKAHGAGGADRVYAAALRRRERWWWRRPGRWIMPAWSILARRHFADLPRELAGPAPRPGSSTGGEFREEPGPGPGAYRAGFPVRGVWRSRTSTRR